MSSFFRKFPILRGVAVYSVLYPASNATQQLLDPTREKFDTKECLRFGIFGVFVVAPTLYGWIKFADIIVKGTSLKHCVAKAVMEQYIWAPYAYGQFFIGINALEGKSWRECVHQLEEKFWPTWKIGFCIWPLVQTINFKFVPERNRVPFISIVSFAWNIFLSYMHHRRESPVFKENLP